MKIFSERKFINVLLLLALLILSLSGIYAYRQAQQMLISGQWVAHTHRVINLANQMLITIENADNAIENLLLLDDKVAVNKLPSLVNKIDKNLITLQALTIDNKIQSNRIMHLKPLLTAKLIFLKKIITAYSTNKQAALTIFADPQLKLTSAQVIEDLNFITSQELKLLNGRSESFTTMLANNIANYAYLIIFCVALLMLAVVLINYHLSKHNKAKKTTKVIESELITANHQLQKSEERFELAMAGSRIGLWDWEIGTNQLYISPYLKQMLGYPDDEIPNTIESFIGHVHPEDLKKVDEAIKKHVKEHVPYELEYRLRSKSGPYQWYHSVGQAIWDESGRAKRMVGSLFDISERKKMEIMKKEFVSVVSHELRTPLTSIRGSLVLLLSDRMGMLNEKVKKLLYIANSNCDRLLLLINDILDIEKIEAGKMKFDFQRVNVNNLISDAVASNQPFADKYHVKLLLSLPDGEIHAIVDPDRIIQVMTNLISNAVKFSTAGSLVKVVVSCYDSKVRVSVIDTGTGIPKEFQAHIFQKFSQADSSSTREKGGTGLGLSISKAIIEKHEGTINFQSTADVGTTFYFDLPLEESHNVCIQMNSSKNVAPRLHLLVCEDDEDQASFLQTKLEDKNIRVDVAVNASETRRRLQEFDYDGLILDLILPDTDGISLIRQLRNNARTANIPIIILSVIAETGKTLVDSQELQIMDWLEKPFDENKLTALINQIEIRKNLEKVD